jgi:ribA/ribD-fused uncharacterized protein
MSATSFRGDLAFLSNFYPAPITGKDGLVYPTVEHAFQACKTTDPAWKERIRTAVTPGSAKRLGRRAPIRADWAQIRLGLMRRIVAQKFRQHPLLADRLVRCPLSPIVEHNYWHDNFWGDCGCPKCPAPGENHLGRILTELRREFGSDGSPVW